MSKYTTEVRFICEQSAGLDSSVGYMKIGDIIDKSVDKIFDFDFPMFDETYRRTLEKKILKHYYTREIASETVSLWKFWMDTRLNEIMPFYNELYKSVIKDFNPNYEFEYWKEGNEKGDSSQVGSSSGESVNSGIDTRTVNTDDSGTVTDDYTGSSNSGEKRKFSDTPQGGVTGLDSDTYLTNYTKIDDTANDQNTNLRTLDTNRNTVDEMVHGLTNNTTSNTTNKIDNTKDYAEHVYGIRNGSNYINMIMELRNAIINVDMMIINELADLFFNLW